MTRQVILEALERAGATFQEESAPAPNQITKQDLMALGLSGGKDSAAKRLELLKKLNLPEHMSANAMLQALNMLYTLDELKEML
jgi:ribonuclease M5